MVLRGGEMVGDIARLVRPLGEGGMGTVWVAHHLRLDTEVAIKVLSTPELRRDPDLTERLRREAKVAATIRSPHVVQIYDQGALPDGSPFLLMELLAGETLGARVEREHVMDLTVAAEVMRQSASAVAAAHAVAVSHRDIKPDNIFLCGDPARPFVKILDFGIALRHGTERLTSVDALVGTPAFMSPESLLGSTELGIGRDIWALAVTGYYMITGELPYADDNLGELVVAITSGKHIPPARFRPALPQSVNTWFARALALDPRSRFPSADELGASYAALCGHAAERIGVSGELGLTLPADEDLMLTLDASIQRMSPMAAAPSDPLMTTVPHHEPMPSSGLSGTVAMAQVDEQQLMPELNTTVPSSPSHLVARSLLAQAPMSHGPMSHGPLVPSPPASSLRSAPARRSSAGAVIATIVLLLLLAAAGVAVYVFAS